MKQYLLSHRHQAIKDINPDRWNLLLPQLTALRELPGHHVYIPDRMYQTLQVEDILLIVLGEQNI